MATPGPKTNLATLRRKDGASRRMTTKLSPGATKPQNMATTPPKKTSATCFRTARARQPIMPRLDRSEEHTSELQSRLHLVCRLLLEKKKQYTLTYRII